MIFDRSRLEIATQHFQKSIREISGKRFRLAQGRGVAASISLLTSILAHYKFKRRRIEIAIRIQADLSGGK